jgi:hypothetical protein
MSEARDTGNKSDQNGKVSPSGSRMVIFPHLFGEKQKPHLSSFREGRVPLFHHPSVANIKPLAGLKGLKQSVLSLAVKQDTDFWSE